MTLPRLAAMLDYWRESPPTHILAAAYMDYKPQAVQEIQKPQSVDDVAAFFAAMNGA